MAEDAAPLIRPLWALRNFVRFGCNMTVQSNLSLGLRLLCVATSGGASTFLRLEGALFLGHRCVRHDLTFEDPDLDADDAVGGTAQRRAVIDVGAKRMQRH